MNMGSLGQNIRSLRLSRGLSQDALAYEAEMSQAVLSQIESGEVLNPGVFTMLKIAEVFGITVDELIHGEGEPSRIKLEREVIKRN